MVDATTADATADKTAKASLCNLIQKSDSETPSHARPEARSLSSELNLSRTAAVAVSARRPNLNAARQSKVRGEGVIPHGKQ